MIHLVLSILCSTSILMIFKTLEKLKIELYQVIIINYAIAAALGMILNGGTGFSNGAAIWQTPWFPLSILIGVFFIGMFFLMGISTQKAGIVTTTISTRMSVVFPILFSILYYRETLSLIKVAGVVLALTALVMSMIKKQPRGMQNRYVYLPAVLFAGMGFLHIVIKFAQQAYIPDEQSAAFTGSVFFFAFVSGVAISVVRRVPVSRFLQKDVLWAGVLLGSCNFGTVFFLINALNCNVFDSSIVFSINGTGIVGCSVLAAYVIFKERLSALNWTGVMLAIFSILLFIKT